MNEKTLNTLEYYRILDRLASFASSDGGKKKCMALRPSDDIDIIKRMQQETSDAVSRFLRNGNISFGGTSDVLSSVMRLEIGSTLSASELLLLASLLENTARAKAYGSRKDADSDVQSPDSLDRLFELLVPETALAADIRRCIISADEISDDASPALRRIRRQIAANGERIHSQLTGMINGSLRTYLQDAVITMRSGRYCLPVKAEYRANVPGMIHDQSSTGATLFIEPMAVVKLNNDIRALEAEEKKEIGRILAELSAEAAGHSEEIKDNYNTLTELDFIFARALLALDMNATRPEFNPDLRIRLKKARHPLIDKKNVVPIDVSLGDDFDLLVITGPNTGGKTVSLKTTGLLCLMGQSGLHIPAADHSELPVFREIYADIGDEQSIEQSLSTFSAHMKNIVSFLAKADTDSLVLFDELGAGTDPTEGAALAMAVLSYLHDRQIRTMATTHYSELKVFALSTPGVENASCEFDVATLKPTYRLLIGVPGKSNAFAISERLGLPHDIIEDARSRISEEDESFEDVLARLDRDRSEVRKEKEKLDSGMAVLERREKELHRREKDLEERRNQILGKANDEARSVLMEAKEYADKTMKDFRRFGKDGINQAEMDRRRNELRKKIAGTAAAGKPSSGSGSHKKSGRKLKPSDLHIGDAVHVISLNLNGTVSSRPDEKGNLYVRCGIIRSKLNINDLELTDETEDVYGRPQHTNSGHISMSKSLSVSPEINLIGKTVDEAVSELGKYLDDAYLAHLETVRIIHGKGTGALRKGIHEYLKRQKNIADFHLAGYGEGDAGVTIVKFR